MTRTAFLESVPLQHQASTLRSDLIPIVLAVLIFSAGSIWAAITSDGFLEADSVTHYIYARHAIVESHYFVNVWGRPLVTALYALPALLYGRMGVRITSLILALTCGFVAYAIARRQQYRWPALALIFTLAQPLVFLHSFSELTELPFAALLGLAFLAYQRRQFLVMTILISLSPLARPEGFGFLVLAVLALIVHRRWWWIPILAIPLLTWDYVGWVRYGWPVYETSLPHALRWLPWLKYEWPYAADSLYKPGSIFHFVMLMPAVASPFIFPALCVGIWQTFRGSRYCLRTLSRYAGRGQGEGLRNGYKSSSDNPPQNPHRSLLPEYREKEQEGNLPPVVAGVSNPNIYDALIAIIPLMILVGHSILYATGKMASSGEMRYMLIVGPFWGLLSAKGWSWIFERMNWRRPLRWAAIAALAPAVINHRFHVGSMELGYHVLPLHLNQDMVIAHRVARWYETWPLRKEYPRMLAAHPGVDYFLDISPTQRLQTREWTKETIADAPRGTILIWDPIYGVFNSDARRSIPEEEIEAAGWVRDEESSYLINDEDAEDKDRWSIWLSPQTQSGMATGDILQMTR